MLSNAIKFTEKGSVSISTKRENNTVHVAVQDTGIGISRENLKRIFDPFFTTTDVGTGLGLYIARDMVIDAGGGISCESNVNKGTKVKIKLPVAS